MSARFLFIASTACLVVAADPLIAQEAAVKADDQTILEQRAEDVVAVLNGDVAAEEVFSDSFLAAVSSEQLAAMNRQLSAQFGTMLGLESLELVGERQARVTYRFERALASGGMEIASIAPYLINGLRLTSFAPLDGNATTIDHDLDALPGDISVYFGPLDGGNPVYARDAGSSYPIGSTFKLYVLSALTRSIGAGERDWADVVPLSVRSLPSGELHNWPQGSPLTLQTLATMMIAGSDNTATDQLIGVLGREAVEAELRASGHGDADTILPLLTTLEMFALKSDLSRGQAYVAANESDQRAQLAALAGDVVGMNIAPWTDARLIDSVEWFATTTDLRGILRRIAESDDQTALDILAVNRSMPEKLAERWDYVGYKGGSEPGVLNFTWLLRDKGGKWHALAMSWKDPANTLDVSTFELFAQRIIALEGS